jgi:hypothetical protein
MNKYFDGNHGKMKGIASARTSGRMPVPAPLFPAQHPSAPTRGPLGPHHTRCPHDLLSTTHGGPLVPRTFSVRMQACRDILCPLGGAPATAASGYGRWSHCNMCNIKFTLQHPNETLAAYVRNTCNVHLKHLQNTQKHLKVIANAYNILIYFGNI